MVAAHGLRDDQSRCRRIWFWMLAQHATWRCPPRSGEPPAEPQLQIWVLLWKGMETPPAAVRCVGAALGDACAVSRC
jgi:hypothetical protein